MTKWKVGKNVVRTFYTVGIPLRSLSLSPSEAREESEVKVGPPLLLLFIRVGKG